jgi:hypothetical protein
MTSSSQTRNAWVQLYEARRVQTIPNSRPPGRPPAPVPRHKVGFTLSQGEIYELETWQQRFSGLLGRKVSLGETVGILARVASARYSRLPTPLAPMSLVQLVEKMIESGD